MLLFWTHLDRLPPADSRYQLDSDLCLLITSSFYPIFILFSGSQSHRASPENAPLMPEKEHHAFSWIVVPMWACPFLHDVASFYCFYVFYAMDHPLLCFAEASRLGHPFTKTREACLEN